MSGNHVPSMNVRLDLRDRVTCPHCGADFPPENVLWVAAHPDLVGDDILDPNHVAHPQQRFLPRRFNWQGNALDARGEECYCLACPNDHLIIPRDIFQTPTLFFSMLGTTFSGKSYYLRMMTRRLNAVLVRHFGLRFDDPDPEFNDLLRQYDQMLDGSAAPGGITGIQKTVATGAQFYNFVFQNGRQVQLPKPVVMELGRDRAPQTGRQRGHQKCMFCFYDVSGELLESGRGLAGEAAMQQVRRAEVLLFLFDPTQHPEFRRVCKSESKDPRSLDPQFIREIKEVEQEKVLGTAKKVMASYERLNQNGKHPAPLLVLMTKFDAWSFLLGPGKLEPPYGRGDDGSAARLDIGAISKVSREMRKLMTDYAPEVVGAANSLSDCVRYYPVSATGRAPQEYAYYDDKNKKVSALGFRPSELKPHWVEVPMLEVIAALRGEWIRRLDGSPGVERATPPAPAPSVPGAASP